MMYDVSNFDHMPKPTGETGRCLVKVTPDSDRTMNTHLGISVTLSEAEVHYEALKQAQYFYIEGYLMSSPSARAAVYKAKNYAKLNGVKTAVSLSDPFMVVQFKDAFDELLKDGVDLIFANEEEAFDYAGTQDLAKAIEKLQKVAQQFVITRGARGSVLFDGIDLHDIPAYPAKPIDTLGAGDMYAGAFLYGVTHGMNELEAAQLASMTAAHVVTQYGPRINATDAKRLLTQFQTEAA
ncbi:MAG: adenosine kinase [Gammaproteobacteria bacterium]|nr:adenosine kinase [Gammaproteobacteria bacterium]